MTKGYAQLMPAEKALRDAELAADRYDRLGAPMTFYQPHVAEMRRRAGLPVDPMLRATRETQGQETDLG